MYNDYYLQEISGKITTTNNNLNTIIQNQNTEIAYLTSGELYLQEIKENTNSINTIVGIIAILLATMLIWNFTCRCWK